MRRRECEKVIYIIRGDKSSVEINEFSLMKNDSEVAYFPSSGMALLPFTLASVKWSSKRSTTAKFAER